MNQTCLIIGAKSDIGKAIAHRFAKAGWNLQLAGRNAAEIELDAADLRIRYKVTATAHELDVLEFEKHAAFYAALTPTPDLVICVAGYMPPQEQSEKDVDLAVKVIGTNFTGCAVLLNLAANAMEARKNGGLIGISSVAGERGRATNYFYGSAKAGFTAFLSGLRNRLAGAGVHVLTVKPGFVYTRMTQGLKLSPRLTATPERVADDIFNAWAKKKNVLWTKGIWRTVMWVIRSVPEWKFKKMKL
jgi:decaprenylphospho-beta-D-erythro-pentofuranosid-2-ulose 2-reductase